MSREYATANFAPVSGTLYLRAMPVQAPNFNNGVTKVTSTAKATGTHGWYVILDAAGNVLTVTADQTDSGTTWGTINTEQPLPFVVPYQTYYNNVRPCYFGVCIVAGTMPTFLAGTTFGNTNLDLPFVMGIGGTGLTTPPVVGSNIAITGNVNNIFSYTT
jgi:hypothetical protein